MAFCRFDSCPGHLRNRLHRPQDRRRKRRLFDNCIFHTQSLAPGAARAHAARRGLSAPSSSGTALSQNPDGIVLKPEGVVCGVLGPQNIFEYASVLRPCSQPLQTSIRPHQVFETEPRMLDPQSGNAGSNPAGASGHFQLPISDCQLQVGIVRARGARGATRIPSSTNDRNSPRSSRRTRSASLEILRDLRVLRGESLVCQRRGGGAVNAPHC